MGLTGTEDFTAYTDTDDSGRNVIRVDSATQCRFEAVDMDESAYLWKDYGAGLITDASHRTITFKLACTGYVSNGRAFTWNFANVADDWTGAGPSIALRVRHNNNPNAWQLTIHEKSSIGAEYLDTYTHTTSAATTFWVTLTWSGDQLTCYIYSDSGRTTLLDTLNLTLQDDSYTFRYSYALRSEDFPLGARSITCQLNDLEYFSGLSDGTADLLAEFYIRKSGSADLKAEFIARHSASEDLRGELVVRYHTVELKAEFIIRHSDTADLLAEVVVATPGTKDLFSKFVVQQTGTAELLAEFVVCQPSTVDLKAEFIIRHSDTSDLLAEVVVATPGTKDLFSKFIVIHTSTSDLKAEFTVTSKWCSGFDAGNFADWDTETEQGTSTVTPDSTRSYTGPYSMKVSHETGNFHAWLTHDVSLSSVYVKLRIWFNDFNFFNSEGDLIEFLSLSDTQGLAGANVRRDAGGVPRWRVAARDGASWVSKTNATMAVPLQQWNEVEVEWVKGAPGAVRMWVNGVLAIENLTWDSDDYGDCTEVKVGGPYAEGLASTAEYWIDDHCNAGLKIPYDDFEQLEAEFFIGSDGSKDLAAEFIIRHSGTSDLSSEFIVRHSATKDLFAKFEIQEQDGSVDLLVEFIVRQSASEDLLGELVVRNPATAELKAEFIVRQLDAEDLEAEFIVRHSASEGLIGEVVVSHSATVELKGEFTVCHLNTRDLEAEFIVRHSATRELYAKFEAQVTRDLYADFTVRHSGTTDLFADFIVRHSATRDLFSKFTVRHSATVDLFSEFIVRHSATVDLFSKFVVRHSATVDLFSKFVVKHSATVDLFSEFIVRQRAVTLFAKMVIRQVGSEGLLSEVIVRHSDAADLFAEIRILFVHDMHAQFWVNPEKDLFAVFWVRQPRAEDLFSEFIVRHSATRELYAKFEAQVTKNLYAKFFAINNDTSDIFCQFYVRQDESRADELEVYPKMVMSVSEEGELTVKANNTFAVK